MIHLFILGGTIRLIVELYQRFFKSRPCQHLHPATYHSTGKKHCYECGLEWDIKNNSYAKHTR